MVNAVLQNSIRMLNPNSTTIHTHRQPDDRMVVATAYAGAGGARRRAQPTRRPVVRLDVVVGLLLLFFLMGLYVPGLVGLSSSAGSGGDGSDGSLRRSLSLFHSSSGGSGGGAMSQEDLEELKGQVAALVGRLDQAEKESKAVMEENARLRLDNRVEQSNLKSLTKAKNDEIKRLKAELDELKKKSAAGGGGGGQGCEEKGRKVEELQRELGETRSQLKRAREQSEDMKQEQEQEQEDEVAIAKVAGDDDDDDESKVMGGVDAVEEEKPAAAPSLNKQPISVPEPQPLNSYWEPRIKGLFELVRACLPACLRASVPACLPACVRACLPAYVSCMF